MKFFKITSAIKSKNRFKKRCVFFLLEQKETKIQESIIPTAQATQHRMLSLPTRGFISLFLQKNKISAHLFVEVFLKTLLNEHCSISAV
jgi:hypothetical protein